MSNIQYSRLYCLLILFAFASASPVRDSPFLNSTISAVQTVPQETAPPVKIPLLASSTTPFTNTHTEPPSFKPHLESSAIGFEDATTQIHRGSNVPSAPSQALPTSIVIRIESTTAGFENLTTTQPTLTPDPQADFPDFRTLASSDRLRPHLEVTATGFDMQHDFTTTSGKHLAPLRSTSGGRKEPTITPPPVAIELPTITLGNKGETLRPALITSVVIDTVTLTPGGETAIIGEGPSATRVYLDASGRPVVVIGGSSSTLQIPATIGGQELVPGAAPITIGSGSEISTISINEAGETIAVVEGHTETLLLGTTQAFTFEGIPATVIADKYQYLIDTSTLSFGQPTTVDGSVIELTTDVSGSTVVIAGDTTITLPALAPAPQITSSLDNVLETIETTVVSGTTQYVIGSHTLAPDHAITVEGTVISITTYSGNTFLIVGDKTSTLEPEASTTQSTTFGGITPAATPGDLGGGEGKAEATSKTASGAMRITRKRWDLMVFVWPAMFGFGLGLG